MRLYLGQTRAADLCRRLWMLAIGECTARGELPPRRHPWFFDNGAYGDWSAAMLARCGPGWQQRACPPVRAEFGAEEFARDLHSIYLAIDRPDWIVVPDIVAGGLDSLAFSASWVHRCRGLAPLYLAVQDGMQPNDVRPLLRHVAGLFVGGTLDWKIRTGGMWADFAHRNGLRCHIGRCGTFHRVRWAQRIGADSLDSSLPLWSKKNLDRFLAAREPASDRQQSIRMESVA